MTDRELLELAAKAAGLKVKGEIDWMDGKTTWLLVKVDGRPKFRWNPLEDDGDAFRLSVKCGIGMVHHIGWGQILHPSFRDRIDFNYEGSSECATRRAIVRAAAEIGKGM